MNQRVFDANTATAKLKMVARSNHHMIEHQQMSFILIYISNLKSIGNKWIALYHLYTSQELLHIFYIYPLGTITLLAIDIDIFEYGLADHTDYGSEWTTCDQTLYHINICAFNSKLSRVLTLFLYEIFFPIVWPLLRDTKILSCLDRKRETKKKPI